MSTLGSHGWGQDYRLCTLKVWIPRSGDVLLVVSKEVNGFHFYVSSRLDFSAMHILLAYKVRHRIEEFYRDVKQNLGLEAYQMRSGRGAIYTLAPGFLRSYASNGSEKTAVETDRRLAKSLATLRRLPMDKESGSRKLIEWLYQKFRHRAKPETIHQMLKI